MRDRLYLVPITLREAHAFVEQHHRQCIGEAGGGTWSREERPRVDTHPTQVKLRWEITLEVGRG